MQIAPDLLEQIVDHALRDAPNECCGLVWLRDGVADEVLAVENMAPSPFRFEVGPRDLLTLADADDDGREASSTTRTRARRRSRRRPTSTSRSTGRAWSG